MTHQVKNLLSRKEIILILYNLLYIIQASFMNSKTINFTMELHVILCMIPSIIFCLHKDWFFNSNTTSQKPSLLRSLCDICICESIFIYIYEHIVIKFATDANYCLSLKKYQFKLEIIGMHFNWRVKMSMSSELNEYILVVYIFEKQLSLFLFFLVSSVLILLWGKFSTYWLPLLFSTGTPILSEH